MADDVGSHEHGLLQHGRGKAIVNSKQSARIVGNISQRLNVAHIGQRIGWRLSKQNFCVRAHGSFPCSHIRLRHHR